MIRYADLRSTHADLIRLCRLRRLLMHTSRRIEIVVRTGRETWDISAATEQRVRCSLLRAKAKEAQRIKAALEGRVEIPAHMNVPDEIIDRILDAWGEE